MLRAIKRFIKLLFVAGLALGFLVFSVDNRQTVTVGFFPLPYSAEMPEFLLAIICFVLGALFSGVALSFGSYQIKRQHNAARRRVMALENEIKAHAPSQEKLPASAEM